MKITGIPQGVMNDAPTIDEVGGENCPSLVSWWDLAEANLTTGNIEDKSGNEYDLTIQCGYTGNLPSNAPECSVGISRSGNPVGAILWSDDKDYLQLLDGWRAARYVANEPLGNTNGRILVYGSEQKWENEGVDSDSGTLWSLANEEIPTRPEPPTGFQIGVTDGFKAMFNRIMWEEAGLVQPSIQSATVTGIQPEFSGDHFGIAAAYRPATELISSIKWTKQFGEDVIKSSVNSNTNPVAATLPNDVVAQAGWFGLTADSWVIDKNSISRSPPMKNWWIWQFETEPPYLNETVEWLAVNAGKIPPWWIGK